MTSPVTQLKPTTLPPCPVCGGKARVTNDWSSCTSGSFVECTGTLGDGMTPCPMSADTETQWTLAAQPKRLTKIQGAILSARTQVLCGPFDELVTYACAKFDREVDPIELRERAFSETLRLESRDDFLSIVANADRTADLVSMPTKGNA